jgi:hypothetical protein
MNFLYFKAEKKNKWITSRKLAEDYQKTLKKKFESDYKERK